MIVRLVCVLASSSCIGAEPAAYVEENVESENTDFRAVGRGPRQRPGMGRGYSLIAYHGESILITDQEA